VPERRAIDLLAELELSSMRLGLERIEELLRRLGHPDRRYSTLLVGGTNGKGSVAAMAAAIAGSAGVRVGLFTSPHLESVRERFRVGGRAVGEVAVVEWIEEVLAVGRELEPSYFEVLTAAALLGFARTEVELAVLEVGLGGRFDATNATEPTISAITTIGVDHTDYLGDDLSSIAGEKAGIMRRGRPALVQDRSGPAFERLREEAARRGADLRPPSDVVVLEDRGFDGQRLRVAFAGESVDLTLGLGGAHQRENAALAVAAAETLAGLHPSIDAVAVRRGLEGCRWPGRGEVVALAGGRVIIDGAHNPSAIEAVVRVLAAKEPVVDVVFGAASDKDGDEMLRLLRPVARRMIVCGFDHPRARSPMALAGDELGLVRVASVDEAIDEILAGPVPHVLFTGSLFLVGEARRRLRERLGRPEPAADLAVWPAQV